MDTTSLVPPSGLDRVVCPELVALLLECARGAILILDTNGRVVATNDAGRALLRTGRELGRIVTAGENDVIETSLGLLRVVRRSIAATSGAPHVVLFAESIGLETGKVIRAAMTRWRPTTRQACVLRYVLEGLSNKEIAAKLGLSVRTVEVHITALFDKAGVMTRTRLIVKARELVLADLPDALDSDPSMSDSRASTPL